MQLNLTGRNVEITPALRKFTTEKFNRIQHRYQQISTINVTFRLENVMQIAEANMHLNGIEIHARSESEDLYSAIDTLVDKLIGQITKHKEKSTDQRRKSED